ncbi:MAG: hypothetical protein IPN76_35200 [Saprospiraceae bacterium]|jgi:hypothetical protein|nr:hypothetical protein [Saprospiraceae bacterium]
MENTVFESKLQSVSRKAVLSLTIVVGIPALVFALIYGPAIFGNIISYIIVAFAMLGLFAIGYLKGFWSSSRIRIFKNDNFFRLEEVGRNGVLASFDKLELANYGWIYEDFSSVITQDMDEDLVSMRNERKLSQKTSNLMVVAYFKSPTASIFLLESISPWRSTPNQLPYFHQPNIDKENVCYYVKGLEKMIANLKLNNK